MGQSDGQQSRSKQSDEGRLGCVDGDTERRERGAISAAIAGLERETLITKLDSERATGHDCIKGSLRRPREHTLIRRSCLGKGEWRDTAVTWLSGVDDAAQRTSKGRVNCKG